MKKFITLSILSFLFFGCDPIEGVITLKQKLNFMTRVTGHCGDGDGSFGCEPQIDSVKPGQYSIKIEQPHRSEILIQIGKGFKAKYISLKTQNREIPMNGRFLLTSIESGQPFDVDVHVKTTITDSSSMHNQSRCTDEHKNQTKCYLVPGEKKSKGINRCITLIDVYYGTRDIDFFDRTTNTRLIGGLISNHQPVAEISGARSNSQRIITKDSGCVNQSFSHTREDISETEVR